MRKRQQEVAAHTCQICCVLLPLNEHGGPELPHFLSLAIMSIRKASFLV
jgi:hypothetical protein